MNWWPRSRSTCSLTSVKGGSRMFQYLVNRVLMIIPTLIVISMISFVIIQLPPGDYLTTYMARLQQSGYTVDQSEIDALNRRYGLDRPMHVQYYRWITGVLRGDFGYSFDWQRPVNQLIWERLALTLAVTTASLFFSWVIAFPIGVYSAVKQYSPGDYFFTFLGFLGLATPNFMIALLLMYVAYRYLGWSVGGLFSPEYMAADWSMGKVVDLLKHLWIPMVVVGTAGTAGLIRVMRNNLLDELSKPYVLTAKSKGLKQVHMLFKYPVRLAIIPFISTVGWQLPNLISGATIVAVVLSLPTAGPLLLRALLSQDMYLAGSFVLLLASLTCIGTLISDVLLALVDPRIRYE